MNQQKNIEILVYNQCIDILQFQREKHCAVLLIKLFIIES